MTAYIDLLLEADTSRRFGPVILLDANVQPSAIQDLRQQGISEALYQVIQQMIGDRGDGTIADLELLRMRDLRSQLADCEDDLQQLRRLMAGFGLCFLDDDQPLFVLAHEQPGGAWRAAYRGTWTSASTPTAALAALQSEIDCEGTALVLRRLPPHLRDALPPGIKLRRRPNQVDL